MSSSSRVVLVTSANGTNGVAIARAIKSKYAGELASRLLVRDTTKSAKLAEFGTLVKGDLSDVASLDAALKGVDSLVLIVPFVEHAVTLTTNAVVAAKRAGVKHIVKLSAFGASKDSALWIGRDHAAQEQIVRDSGIPFTLLQPTFFQQNFLNFNSQTLKGHGAYYGSSGTGAYSAIHVDDTAEVTAAILAKPSDYTGQTLVLTGPEALTDEQIAALATKTWGKTIKYVDAAPDAYLATLKSYGLPDWQATSLNGLQQVIRHGYAKDVSPVVEKILGRKGKTFADYFKENAGAI